jgi:hypothetical protein
MIFGETLREKTQPRAGFYGLNPFTYAGFVARFVAQLSERGVHRSGGASHGGLARSRPSS